MAIHIFEFLTAIEFLNRINSSCLALRALVEVLASLDPMWLHPVITILWSRLNLFHPQMTRFHACNSALQQYSRTFWLLAVGTIMSGVGRLIRLVNLFQSLNSQCRPQFWMLPGVMWVLSFVCENSFSSFIYDWHNFFRMEEKYSWLAVIKWQSVGI